MNLHPPRDSPGPAAYGQVPIEKYRKSNPKYSIKGKTPNDYSTFVPGPGKYENRSSSEGPKFSFQRSNSVRKLQSKEVCRMYGA